MKKENKALSIILTVLTVILLIASLGYSYFGMKKINKQYNEQINEVYEENNKLLNENAQLKADNEYYEKELEIVNGNLSRAEAVIEKYEAQVEEQKRKEEERWNSLTKEEQDAELHEKEVLEMMNYLYDTNDEYREIIVYLQNESGKVYTTIEECDEVIAKFERKAEIEEEYKNSKE